MSIRRSLPSLALAVATACVAFAAVAPPPDEERASRPSAEDWRHDVDHLVRQVRLRHPNPGHFGPPWEEFVAEAERLGDELADMEDWRRPWEVSRLLARLWDGHTWVDPWSFGADSRALPLVFEHFEDGLFVVAAADEDLLGRRVVRIGAATPDALLERARALRLTSWDNDMALRWWTTHHLRLRGALAVLGAIPEPGPVTFVLEDAEGERREVTFGAAAPTTGATGASAGAPRPLAGLPRTEGVFDDAEVGRPGLRYAARIHADEKVLQIRYDGFVEDPGLSWQRFCDEAFALFPREGLRRLVLDLRHNGGGDPAFGVPLMRAILRRPELDAPGALVVLIGPGTDSAAVSFCAELEWMADPVFVGRPTFLRPNGHGSAHTLELPRTGAQARISTLYWRAGHPSDRRPWIAPHVPVPVTFADRRDGRDRALESALEGPEPLAPGDFAPTLRRGRAGEDLQAALADWRGELRNRWADVEMPVNALGYRLMGAGRLDDALEVFAANVRLHPHAWNVHDSLGEALLEAGRKREALASYRESMRRECVNVAAIDVILRLEEELGLR